jgi:hypothetical protein
MSRKRIRNYLADMWQPVIIYGGILAGFASLLLVRISTLLPGFTGTEVQAYQASENLETILNHPLNAPFTLLTHGLTYLSDHTYLLARLSAIAFGFATLIAFLWLLNHWYGRRTAVIGTVLFGASAWFLHTSRFGAPDVLLFLPFVLVACGVWLKKSNSSLALLICFILGALLLYVPGMVWFVALAVIWQWRTIDRLFKRHLWIVTLGGLLLIGALAPLGYAIYRMPEMWKTLVGLPADGWPQVVEVLRNLYEIPMAFFFRYQDASPETWLGNVPILDVFSMAMVLLGGYVFLKHWHLHRVKVFALVLVVGTALISLGGSVTLSLLVPFVYMLVAVGAGYVLDQWYRVFPRNPIAHTLGLTLVGVAVLIACTYQLRHYFMAWPANSETKALYAIPEALPSDKID